MFAGMTMQEATYFLLNKLYTIYDKSEASQVTDWVLEKLTGSKKAERMIYKNETITSSEENTLKQYTERLLQHEPVQYVLNEAWFGNMKFYVDRNVLIPRPETEELIEWIISNCKFPLDELKILDIGTGSGCIPVSLKRRLRKAEVWSCDISAEALAVAKKNADELGVEVKLIQLDFLDQRTWTQLPSFDIIVSNPPYIPEKDKENMQANVLQYEPASALFVPDNDALIFYKAIAVFGKTYLKKEGNIFMEIHESLGKDVSELFKTEGYTVEVKKDMQQKDRMIKSGLL
jgi:release factor glutamine methyltransferase